MSLHECLALSQQGEQATREFAIIGWVFLACARPSCAEESGVPYQRLVGEERTGIRKVASIICYEAKRDEVRVIYVMSGPESVACPQDREAGAIHRNP